MLNLGTVLLWASACISFFRVPSVAQDINTTKHALMALKSSFPDSAEKFESWRSENPCDGSWRGIICDSKAITKIDLGGCGLKGVLPLEIFDLVGIKELYLQDNGIHGNIPKAISKMVNLEVLWIHNNSFDGEIPSEIGHLKNCKSVSLHNNLFVGSVPKSLETIPQLRIIPGNRLCNSVPGEKCVKSSEEPWRELPSGSCSPQPPFFPFSFFFTFLSFSQHPNHASHYKSSPCPYSLLPNYRSKLFSSPPLDIFSTSVQDVNSRSLRSNSRSMLFSYSREKKNAEKSPSSCKQCPTGYITTREVYCRCVEPFMFQLRFLDLDYESFGSIQNALLSQLAEGLRIKPNQFQVVSVVKGSVVLTFNILPEKGSEIDQSEKQFIISRIKLHELTLSSAFMSYQILSLPNTNWTLDKDMALKMNPNSIPNSNSFFNRELIIVSISVGSLLVVFFIVLVVVIVVKYKGSYATAKLTPSDQSSEQLNEVRVNVDAIIGPLPSDSGKESSCSSNNNSGTSLKSRSKKHSRKRRRNEKLLRLLKSKRKIVFPPPKSNHVDHPLFALSLKDIQLATEDYNSGNFISESWFSTMYMGELPKLGKLHVVVLKGDKVPEEEYLGRISALSDLKNPYLIPLIGYCMDQEVRCIVYKDIQSSSLYDHLHGELRCSRQLNWFRRVLIAIDLADVLAYLHESIVPCIIHKNIQGSNVILDGEFRALLVGAGASTLVKDKISDYDINSIKPSPYLAPEVRFRKVQIAPSDVFSFGILMMELFTGRMAYDDNRPKGQKSLLSWVLPHSESKRGVQMLVDPYLHFDSYFDITVGQAFVQLAADCVQLVPSDRPKMSEVRKRLGKMLPEVSSQKNGSTAGPAFAEVKLLSGSSCESHEISNTTSEVESVATRNTADTASSAALSKHQQSQN